MNRRPEVIVALDVETVEAVDLLINALSEDIQWYKIGKQLFTRCGHAAVQRVKERGKKLFLDLKFHDIPNTVAGAVAAAVAIGADMVNVHASGGSEMMKAAARAAAGSDTEVIAVTVLTSMDDEALRACGIDGSVRDHVARLTALTVDAGLDGVVASVHEIPAIRAVGGEAFSVVTPGIRPAGFAADDQKRIVTPRIAAAAGSNYLVVGRPITRAADPAAAAKAIVGELAGVTVETRDPCGDC